MKRDSLLIRSLWRRLRLRVAYEVASRSVENCLRRNPALRQRIEEVRRLSKSTGCSLGDYVVLYEFIRRLKPRIVLECGTGMSTHVIAQAMLDQAGGKHEAGMKLISMESVQDWRDHNIGLLPAEFRGFTEILFSPAVEYAYSFIRGSAYEQVPDYQYELVFVDGPTDTLPGGARVCNMDFVRVVTNSQRPVWGIIDGRPRTVMAYQAIFGHDKVRYYPAWNLSVVRGVTKQDLRLEDNNHMAECIGAGAIGLTYGRPFAL